MFLVSLESHVIVTYMGLTIDATIPGTIMVIVTNTFRAHSPKETLKRKQLLGGNVDFGNKFALCSW